MKKKLLIIAVAACLLALTIAGTSIAYFTDTEAATNVFTAGDVNITLTYAGQATAEVEANSTVLNLGETHVYPGQTYPINAYITNVGSEKAYVGAVITLTDDVDITAIVAANSDTDKYPVAIRAFLNNLVDSGYTVKYAVSVDNKVLTIYVVKEVALDEKTGTTTTCTLFTDVVIPAEWDNAEMKAFNGVKLDVVAYATQTVGFAANGTLNAAEVAITSAFKDTAWADYTSALDVPALPVNNG